MGTTLFSQIWEVRNVECTCIYLYIAFSGQPTPQTALPHLSRPSLTHSFTDWWQFEHSHIHPHITVHPVRAVWGSVGDCSSSWAAQTLCQFSEDIGSFWFWGCLLQIVDMWAHVSESMFTVSHKIYKLANINHLKWGLELPLLETCYQADISRLCQFVLIAEWFKPVGILLFSFGGEWKHPRPNLKQDVVLETTNTSSHSNAGVPTLFWHVSYF